MGRVQRAVDGLVIVLITTKNPQILLITCSALSDFLSLCQCVTSNIDENVLELSKKNMQLMNADKLMHYVAGDAIAFCEQEKLAHDFIVLDAEGPKTGLEPDLLDKAIYYPMLKAATVDLAEDGTVLFHNILLNNYLADSYFEHKIRDNFKQFEKLLMFIESHFSTWSHYCSTEGVGIARYKRVSS